MFLISEAYMEACSQKTRFFDYFKNIDGSVKIRIYLNLLCQTGVSKICRQNNLFVNIYLSEMEPFIVENYIKHILRLK